jgi:membrane protease subunit HflC
MRLLSFLILIIAGAGVLAAFTATYTVSEREQALVLRFGQVVNVVNEPGDEDPGLHFKLPLADQVIYFDKRNLEFDMRPAEILASDQERLVVDAFLRFRIVDPLRVYQTARDERGLRDRLRPIMDDSLRGVIASIESNEVISGQRSILMDRIEASVRTQVANQDLGVEVIDVRILRADLPQQITNQVFQRMRSEREQQAQLIRSEGEEQAREIRARAEREATVIRANAQAEADRIRGEGDGERNRIYAAAYGQDPEFTAFYLSLIAYENAIRDGTPIVVPPNSEFFRYFQGQLGSAPGN